MEIKIFGFFLEKCWVFLTFFIVCYLLTTESKSTFEKLANTLKVDSLSQKLSSNPLRSGVASCIFLAI